MVQVQAVKVHSNPRNLVFFRRVLRGILPVLAKPLVKAELGEIPLVLLIIQLAFLLRVDCLLHAGEPLRRKVYA